jgi:peroxiredoxin
VPLSPGDRAPPASAAELSGRPAALAPAGGRPRLLLFYRADCRASEIAGTVLPRFGAVPGLDVVAVSQDPPPATAAFAAERALGPAVRVVVDPQPFAASDAFRVRSTPTWVLLDGRGTVVAVAEGWSRDDAIAIAAAAARLCGAAPVVVAPPGGAEPPLRPG